MKNILWLEAMIKKASEEGNYTDWQNYSDMLGAWKKKEVKVEE